MSPSPNVGADVVAMSKLLFPLVSFGDDAP
jgi:hypothetical protein